MASPNSNTDAPAKTIRITLVRSPLGYSKRHKATVRSLGLHRQRHVVELTDTPQVRGMIAKVSHLITIEELS